MEEPAKRFETSGIGIEWIDGGWTDPQRIVNETLRTLFPQIKGKEGLLQVTIHFIEIDEKEILASPEAQVALFTEILGADDAGSLEVSRASDGSLVFRKRKD